VSAAFDAPLTSEAERDYIVKFPSRGVWRVALRRSDGRVVGLQVLEPFGPYTTAFDHVGNDSFADAGSQSLAQRSTAGAIRSRRG
jgi:hypothetical protein